MFDKPVQQIEKEIREAKDILDVHAAMQRLKDNRDFKLAITGHYLRDEALRLVGLRADPNCQSPERQAMINKQLDAIAFFEDFFRTMDFKAGLAMKAIQDGEEAIQEAAQG